MIRKVLYRLYDYGCYFKGVKSVYSIINELNQILKIQPVKQPPPRPIIEENVSISDHFNNFLFHKLI